MRFLTPALCIALAVAMAAPAPAEEDKRSDRVRVKGETIHRGSRLLQIRAIEQDGLCRPDLGDEELIKAYIAVSDVGATALSFDLHGFNEDATALDPEHVATVRRIKDGSNYRWMPTIVRVLGALEGADHATRLAAVQTTATTFEDEFSILFWIDGPKSDELVKQFKKIAPKLAVLAPRKGDIQLVQNAGRARSGRASLIVGAIPPAGSNAGHYILPDAPESYEAVEKAMTAPAELEPWRPETVGLSREEVLDGWTVLYNGHGLDGWVVTGWNPQGIVSKDGVIVRQSGGGDSLRTRDRYGDFVLRIEWKLNRVGANSGIFLRAPRANRESKMGFEFQLMGDYGEEPHKNGTGSVYDVIAPSSNPSRPVGEWNELEIRLDGPRYKATLNGVVIQDIDFDEHEDLKHRLRRGFIALQDHGATVAFRNIRIKKL